MVVSHLKAGFAVSKAGIYVVCKHCRGKQWRAGPSARAGGLNQSRILECPLLEVSLHSFTQ